jgi:putative transposase
MAKEHETRKAYPSGLTAAQWLIIAPWIPVPRYNRGGRPRDLDRREVLNPLLDLNRSGCQWELLSHDVLPKRSVSAYFAQWREDGTWTKRLTALRERVRREAGREPPQCRGPREASGEDEGNRRKSPG